MSFFVKTAAADLEAELVPLITSGKLCGCYIDLSDMTLRRRRSFAPDKGDDAKLRRRLVTLLDSCRETYAHTLLYTALVRNDMAVRHDDDGGVGAGGGASSSAHSHQSSAQASGSSSMFAAAQQFGSFVGGAIGDAIGMAADTTGFGRSRRRAAPAESARAFSAGVERVASAPSASAEIGAGDLDDDDEEDEDDDDDDVVEVVDYGARDYGEEEEDDDDDDDDVEFADECPDDILVGGDGALREGHSEAGASVGALGGGDAADVASSSLVRVPSAGLGASGSGSGASVAAATLGDSSAGNATSGDGTLAVDDDVMELI